jgi:hypothetical protein
MLWIVLALQAMTPFIHAHADVMHLTHADGPHLHQALSAEAAGHAVVAGEHDVTVAVAQGLPSRDAADVIEAPARGIAARPTLCVSVALAAAAYPIPPPLHLSPPDHAFPLTQAPPRR